MLFLIFVKTHGAGKDNVIHSVMLTNKTKWCLWYYIRYVRHPVFSLLLRKCEQTLNVTGVTMKRLKIQT